MIRVPAALRQWRVGALGALAVLAATVATGGEAMGLPPLLLQSGAWEYLSDRPWVSGDSGWFMMSNEGIPNIDGAFITGEPLTLGEHTYGKGFGCWTPSEIVYQLDGGYSRLEATVGVQPDDRPEPPSQRRIRFLVFADAARVYESPPLAAGGLPLHITAPLRGASRLRLVTVRDGAASAGARCVWGDVRIQAEPRTLSAGERAEADRVRAEAAARVRRLETARQQLSERARSAVEAAQAASAAPSAALDTPAPGALRLQDVVALLSDRLLATVAVEGSLLGRITVIDTGAGQYVLHDVLPVIHLPEAPVALNSGRPVLDAVQVTPVDDPALGPGRRLDVPFQLREHGLRAVVSVTVFDRGSHVFLDLAATQTDGSPLPPERRPLRFEYATGVGGSWYVGADARYLTDLVRLHDVPLVDDGLTHDDFLGWTTPLYLYDPLEELGTLVSVLEATPLPPAISLRRDPERVTAQAQLRLDPAVATDGITRAPRVYLSTMRGARWQDGFEGYRRLMARLAPPPALPDWFGPQWLSWYVYYMDMDEAAITRQIDLLSEHFSDLGPWHIIVDAGWYRAEGLPGAEWRNPDTHKFPHGMRWLVDYAHSKGVKVVLYFSAPYLNTNEVAGNWLGLRGIIDAHPSWVIPLNSHTPAIDYIYDLSSPDLRAYLAGVLYDYFVTYDVDGLKLDGLGSAGESVFVSAEGAAAGMSMRALEQTLDLYRFVYEQATSHKPAAYVEAGWLTPTFANRYAQTFRYGDEDPSFSRSYPLPGLAEHIDYTAYQQAYLGQRSNIGAIYGDPNESQVNRWWLGAALALDAQVSLSLDLATLTPDSVASYRTFLAAYRPFTGQVRVDDGVQHRVFSTTREGVTYAGVLNRLGQRTITVTAAGLGLDPQQPFFVFDTEDERGFGAQGEFAVDMAPESFRLLVVRTGPGVVWGNARLAPDGPLSWQLMAPPTVPGAIYLYLPNFKAVYWDDLRLEPDSGGGATLGIESRGDSGLLKVVFPPGGAHRLRWEP